MGPESESGWTPDDTEELVVRTLFELNARTIEMHTDIQAIRRLLEDDEDEEDGGNGESDE